MFSSSTSNELNDKTATELLELINKREIGCVELISSCINRYETINHSINAIVETNFDEAIKICKTLDSDSSEKTDAATSLPLPIGIKDLNDVKGLKTSYGSPLFRDNVAEEDDDVVLNYVFRPETQYWPPTFTMWVIFRLASVFALSVTRKADIAQSYTQLAEGQFRRAKARDSQQVTNQNLRLSRYHRARLGNGIYQNIEGT